eukprot:TRINITY_DN16426_c0_g1_i2.p1 TRINITY_DN16426_c0_g1~~TRINITY_DN16426_c0_g1_i2.p1  ORF type:complete len:261 (+),score=58.48 TRINITY_DN16426_c0_g1_i2:126-908(+)
MEVKRKSTQLSPNQQRRLQVADAYSTQAGHAFANGEYESAAFQYSQALSIEKETLLGSLGPDGKATNTHARIATTYFNLGVSYFANSEFAEAVTAYKKALEIELALVAKTEEENRKSNRSSGAAANPSVSSGNTTMNRRRENVAMTYYNLSLSEQEIGEYEEALRDALQALQLFRSTVGGLHQLSKNAEVQAKELKELLEAEKKRQNSCCCFGVSEEKRLQMRLKDRQSIRSRQVKEMRAVEDSKSDANMNMNSRLTIRS